MAKETILVVEDDENILELITFHLSQVGYTVQQTFTGEEALERASLGRPDLILLDLMLPRMNGLKVCAKLKGDMATRRIPIIIVSARGADTDVVAGLEAGADDYITKPFRPVALIADVQTMLRRAGRPRPDAAQALDFGDLTIQPQGREVCVAGVPVTLTDTEFQVLHYLALQAGRICTRNQIKAHLGYAEDSAGEGDICVDDQVIGLGKALGDAGHTIEMIRRIGYRFKDSDS